MDIKRTCENCTKLWRCIQEQNIRFYACRNHEYDEQRFGKLRKESHWFWGNKDNLI